MRPPDRAGITVVVATRDRRDELHRTLCRLQDMPERPPVIVVDNGSADGSADHVSAAFPDVHVVRLRADAGARARTVGVEQARTPLVAFSDDDSWWAPGALRRAAATFARFPRLGLITGRVLVGATGRLDPLSAAMRSETAPAGLPGPPVLGFLACAAVVRRSAYLQAGGFSGGGFGGEEALLALDLIECGWQLVYDDALIVHHHPSSNREPFDRAVSVLHNELRTAWLRRRSGHAAQVTLAAAARAAHDRAARLALLRLLKQAPDIRRERRPVSPALERRLAES
jgi:GT2 family glycosyltransferase